MQENLTTSINYNIIDLLHYDICFALHKLKEQIETNHYKFLFICADRKLFDINEFVNYWESNPQIKKARIKDILYKAINIIDLHNTVFVGLEPNTTNDKQLNNEQDCEYIIINGEDSRILSYEGYKNTLNPHLFKRYASDVFARHCALIYEHITAFNKKLYKEFFYSDIINRLYLNDLVIKGKEYTDPYMFIEAKHNKSKNKGVEFYECMLEEYDRHKEAKMVYKRGAFFYDESATFINYCKRKIEELNPTNHANILKVSLDFYFNTPDEHFNNNAQSWYFEFTGVNKPDTKKEFSNFINAIHEIYFFILDNSTTPFACIEKIKNVSNKNKFLKKEKVYLLNKITGILFNSGDSAKIGKVFIQIVDYRNSLEPYLDDPKISNHSFEFDFEAIKEESSKIEVHKDKFGYLANVFMDFKERLLTMNYFDKLYYSDTKFIEKLGNEINRIQILNGLEKTSTATELNKSNNEFSEIEINKARLYFEPKTYGKDEVLKLLTFCATQIEKWQITNLLDDTFNTIPEDRKAYVFSNRFEFLQKLRIELENNAVLFATDEAKFREIEKWALAKMSEKVNATVDKIPFNLNKNASDIIKETKQQTVFEVDINIINNFDNVKIDDVYDHFHKGLVEKHYLSKQTLMDYLTSAFEKKIVPADQFKLVNFPTKQKVITVFYQYYKNVAGKPHGKQKIYASLLGDYFEGYKTENVSTNFNK